jgi:methylmalonyl-CoA mutase
MNFPSRADWEQAAAAAMRKARLLAPDDPDDAVWDKLAKTTLDGLKVSPLGVSADLDVDNMPGARRNLSRVGGWDVRVRTSGGPAALDELETGATSLWLAVPGGTSVAKIDAQLQGVLVDLAPVVLESPDDPAGAARAFVGWLQEHAVVPGVGANLGADPLGRAVISTGSTTPALAAQVSEIAQLSASVGVAGFVIDATVVHDRGASDVQELGYSLAAGATYLRLLADAGVEVDQAFDLMEFRYAATDEQFLTIAKFRAARQLWARVREVCGTGPVANPQRQHAVTSRPMMTRYDPWVNMLRGTVAAFAAGVGGADAVTVIPFDSALGEPDEFGRRIARNTSSLLVEESHVARAADPAAGSYAVERLTRDLAEAGWAEFVRIEEAGGVLAQFGDRSATETDASASGNDAWARLREVSGRRATLVATRERPITGVSEFPNVAERLPERSEFPNVAERLPERSPHAAGEWEVTSYAAEFEALRDLPEACVYLAAMGPVAEHTGRAMFMTQLFGAGGLAVRCPGPLPDTDAARSSYEGQPLVCLVGSDQSYLSWGAELIAGLRDQGARHVMIAGRAGGLDVDDSFAPGDDALAFLRRARGYVDD